MLLCKNCHHFKFYHICQRIPLGKNPVTGEELFNGLSAYDERAPHNFWEKLISRDKCGPEAQYFTPKEDPQCSTEPTAASEFM